MDEEAKDANFESDGEMCQFFDYVTEQETVEACEEEVLLEGVIPEDKTAAVDENTIANWTVDAGDIFDAADNLPSADDASPLYTSFLNTTQKR